MRHHHCGTWVEALRWRYHPGGVQVKPADQRIANLRPRSSCPCLERNSNVKQGSAENPRLIYMGVCSKRVVGECHGGLTHGYTWLQRTTTQSFTKYVRHSVRDTRSMVYIIRGWEEHRSPQHTLHAVCPGPNWDQEACCTNATTFGDKVTILHTKVLVFGRVSLHTRSTTATSKTETDLKIER